MQDAQLIDTKTILTSGGWCQVKDGWIRWGCHHMRPRDEQEALRLNDIIKDVDKQNHYVKRLKQSNVYPLIPKR